MDLQLHFKHFILLKHLMASPPQAAQDVSDTMHSVHVSSEKSLLHSNSIEPIERGVCPNLPSSNTAAPTWE